MSSGLAASVVIKFERSNVASVT